MTLQRLGRGARVVAVSPHLDDAVFSLGATLAEAVRAGLDVVNLTVFAGVPASRRLPAGWDRQARFTSDGAAARRRQLEDRSACAAIGARPEWLPFRDDQYGDERSSVWSSLEPVLVDADALLLPGFPLLHPDHRWVTERVWSEREHLPPIGFYVEQPYAEAVWFRRRELPERGGGANELVGEALVWTRSRPSPACWWQKQKAFAAYSSQLRAMTRPGARVLLRVGAYDVRRRGEWLGVPASRPFLPPRRGRPRAAPAAAPDLESRDDEPRRTTTPAPAVLLGGLANAVSVARALADTGVPVHALGQGGWDAVEHSRAIREYVRAVPGDLQAGWLARLESEAPRLPGAVLLPCGDDGLELIARERARLVGWGYRPVVADDDVVLAMLDKGRTYELAERVGIPVPRTVVLGPGDDGSAAAEQLGYPFALKPSHSHVFMRAVGGAKALVVAGSADLEAALRRTATAGLEMIATEIIPGGPDALFSYYSYVDPDGVPLFHATKRKLRQSPVDFGALSYGVTEWNAEVAELGSRLFAETGLRGLAEVEFKHDVRDGRFKLIECNHRFVGSNELVRRAGIDLARLTYNRAAGLPDPPLDRYRDGVRLWGPILDTHAFLEMRARGELRPRDWVLSLLHRQHLQVFRVRDPKPTVVDVTRRAGLLLTTVARGRAAAGPHREKAPVR